MILRILNDTFYALIYASFLDSLLWWKRHLFMVNCVLLLQTTCVYGLKESIRMERPYHYGIGHSFPSAFSANVMFLCIYYLWLIQHHRKLWSTLRYAFLAVCIVTYTLGLLVARHHLMYNNVLDVAVGSVIGGVFAAAFIRVQLYYQVSIEKWD